MLNFFDANEKRLEELEKLVKKANADYKECFAWFGDGQKTGQGDEGERFFNSFLRFLDDVVKSMPKKEKKVGAKIGLAKGKSGGKGGPMGAVISSIKKSPLKLKGKKKKDFLQAPRDSERLISRWRSRSAERKNRSPVATPLSCAVPSLRDTCALSLINVTSLLVTHDQSMNKTHAIHVYYRDLNISNMHRCHLAHMLLLGAATPSRKPALVVLADLAIVTRVSGHRSIVGCVVATQLLHTLDDLLCALLWLLSRPRSIVVSHETP